MYGGLIGTYHTPSNSTIPDPLWGDFLEIGGLQLSYTLLSQDFKFGRYIYLAIPKPFKILQKMERWRIHGLSKFFGSPYYLWNG